MNFMKDNPDTLYFNEDETHYLKSAEAMIFIGNPAQK